MRADHSTVEVAVACPTRGGEHSEHLAVVGERVGRERVDTLRPGDHREVLEQQRADPTPLMFVGDDERDLGHARLHDVVAGGRDDVVTEHGDPRDVSRFSETVELERGGSRARHRREESEVDRVGAHPLVHLGEARLVAGAHRTHVQGRTVGEDDVALEIGDVVLVVGSAARHTSGQCMPAQTSAGSRTGTSVRTTWCTTCLWVAKPMISPISTASAPSNAAMPA